MPYQVRWSRLVDGAHVDTPYFPDGRLFDTRDAARAVVTALITSGAHAPRKGLYVKQLPAELPGPVAETLAGIHGVFVAMERLLAKTVQQLQDPAELARRNGRGATRKVRRATSARAGHVAPVQAAVRPGPVQHAAGDPPPRAPSLLAAPSAAGPAASLDRAARPPARLRSG